MTYFSLLIRFRKKKHSLRTGTSFFFRRGLRACFRIGSDFGRASEKSLRSLLRSSLYFSLNHYIKTSSSDCWQGKTEAERKEDKGKETNHPSPLYPSSISFLKPKKKMKRWKKDRSSDKIFVPHACVSKPIVPGSKGR